MDHILPRGHFHTPNHQLDCYALIFPLYVAAKSNAIPDMRPWIIKNLYYMSTHFHIRNAELVARILEQETDVDPGKYMLCLEATCSPVSWGNLI